MKESAVIMIRGTTPTLEIKIDGINIDELSKIFLTIQQGKTEITKENKDIEAGKRNTMSVFLSQEETLRFAKGYIWVQLRAITKDGLAVASNVKGITVEDILKDGEIQ